MPDGAMAWITCRVVKLMDAGTHTIFLGEVTDCDLNREDGIPMTYQFYHSVIKGASPKNAPTFKHSWTSLDSGNRGRKQQSGDGRK